MPFNGSGVFQRVRNWVADATAGVKIRADYHDAEDDGFAAGLTNCITKDGQTTITQNIPFNSKRITGLADPINPQDVATKAYADTKVPGTSDQLCPPGALMDFAGVNAPAGWLTCDGQEVSRTTYAALFAAIGATWGAGNGSTTFNVPNMQSRFRRHRDNNAALAGTVGTLKGPVNLTHTHTGSGTSSSVSTDHTHHIDFMSQGADRALSHSHGGINLVTEATSGGFVTAPGANYVWHDSYKNTDNADAPNHLHQIIGDTQGISANHTHTYSFTTSGGSADDGNEARPYSAAVLTCIKT